MTITHICGVRGPRLRLRNVRARGSDVPGAVAGDDIRPPGPREPRALGRRPVDKRALKIPKPLLTRWLSLGGLEVNTWWVVVVIEPMDGQVRETRG